MKCHYCGAEEDENGGRKHAPDCVFNPNKAGPYAPDTPEAQAACARQAEPVKAATPMRLLQFTGHVELTPEGEPLRVTVLISGGLASTFELGEDGELSIGDAVDLALTRAGRRLLSVDVI